MASKTVQVIIVGDSRSAQAALKSLNTTAGVAESKLASLGSKLQTLGGGMSRVGGSLSRWVTLPLVGAAAASVHFATDFDQSMRNVNSIMGQSEAQFTRTSQAVLDLSTRFPQDAKTLADGLYDIASSGFQGADGLKVLQVSARAASAGMSDTATSAKAVTAVLNAYGGSADDATHVSDVLFTAVNKGVETFDEISSSIGSYIGAASQLKVPIEEAAGAQAAMTLSGVGAAEAATSLNGIFKSLLKPSDDLKSALKDLGYESGQAALESEGLDGIMRLLSDKVGDDKSKWVALFPEIRAARGAMALAANDGKNLNTVMDSMADATGATSRAFREQAKGPAFQFEIALNKLKKAGIEIGNQLIPIITNDLIPAFQKALDWWNNLSDGSKELALKIAGITLVVGPLLRVFGPLVGLAGRFAGWLPQIVPWLAKWGAIKSLPTPVAPVGGMPVPTGIPGAAAPSLLTRGGNLLGVGALAYAGFESFKQFQQYQQGDVLGGLQTSFQAGSNLNIGGAGGALGNLADVIGEHKKWEDAATSFDQVNEAFRTGEITADQAKAAIGELASNLDIELAPSVFESIDAMTGFKGKSVEATGALTAYASKLGITGKNQQTFADAVASSRDITNAQAAAIGGAIAKLEPYHRALSEGETAALDGFIATGQYDNALDLLARLADDAADRHDRLNRFVDDFSVKAVKARGRTKGMASEYGQMGDQVDTAASNVADLIGKIRTIPRDVTTRVHIDRSEITRARADVDNLILRLANLRSGT